MNLKEAKRNFKKRDFNLSAMKELILKKSFLKARYDKLSVGAEERFGYHWNEVICNVLYNKYVKNEPELLKEYQALKIKHERLKDIAKGKLLKKEIEKNNISQHPSLENEPTVKPIEPIAKSKEISSKELTETTTSASSGAYSTPFAWSKGMGRFFKPMKGYKIFKNNIKNTLMEKTNLDSLLEQFGSLVTEFEQNLGSNIDDNYDDETENENTSNKYTFHIVQNDENEFYADIRDEEGNTIYEINSSDEIEEIINDILLTSSEAVQKLEQYLKDKEIIGQDDSLEHDKKNKEIEENIMLEIYIPDGYSLNEEMKPKGLIQAERIKQQNKENSLTYYKEMNVGLKDMVNSKKDVNQPIDKTIKYDYDKDKVESKNAVYPYEEEHNNEYYKTASRGPQDSILDVPNDIYEKRLKKMVGTKNYNMIKDKQNSIKKLDLRNTQKGKYEVVDHMVKESYLSGFYFDNINNKKIKTTALSKVETTYILSEDLKYFETKGVGNAYDERLKEEIENYNFYFNLKENKFVKIPKEKDTNNHKNILSESAITKIKKLSNYDPSVNTRVIVDKSLL